MNVRRQHLGNKHGTSDQWTMAYLVAIKTKIIYKIVLEFGLRLNNSKNKTFFIPEYIFNFLILIF